MRLLVIIMVCFLMLCGFSEASTAKKIERKLAKKAKTKASYTLSAKSYAKLTAAKKKKYIQSVQSAFIDLEKKLKKQYNFKYVDSIENKNWNIFLEEAFAAEVSDKHCVVGGVFRYLVKETPNSSWVCPTYGRSCPDVPGDSFKCGKIFAEVCVPRTTERGISDLSERCQKAFVEKGSVVSEQDYKKTIEPVVTGLQEEACPSDKSYEASSGCAIFLNRMTELKSSFSPDEAKVADAANPKEDVEKEEAVDASAEVEEVPASSDELVCKLKKGQTLNYKLLNGFPIASPDNSTHVVELRKRNKDYFLYVDGKKDEQHEFVSEVYFAKATKNGRGIGTSIFKFKTSNGDAFEISRKANAKTECFDAAFLKREGYAGPANPDMYVVDECVDGKIKSEQNWRYTPAPVLMLNYINPEVHLGENDFKDRTPVFLKKYDYNSINGEYTFEMISIDIKTGKKTTFTRTQRELSVDKEYPYEITDSNGKFIPLYHFTVLNPESLPKSDNVIYNFFNSCAALEEDKSKAEPTKNSSSEGAG